MNNRNDRKDITRKINPKLGFLGFLGLLGFMGIWTYTVQGVVFPFIFFSFFGFFGFFFEGKMANTLMDERYMENRTKAQLQAYRIGFSITAITLIASTWDWLFQTNDTKLLFITIALSGEFALVAFLAEYLLYRYDSKESDGE